MNLDEIKQHWEEAGKGFPLDCQVTPTSRDPYLGDLERENILDFLSPDLSCLELGCGDGFHTAEYTKKSSHLSALDVSGSLINLAQIRMESLDISNVDFHVASVLDIEKLFEGKTFDRIISQRCLINLPDWESQKQAIQQIHGLLSEDGLLILSEGFQENLDALNGVRSKVDLPEIKVVDYNKNFPLIEFESFVRSRFEIVEKRHYGPYLFFSRVFHPLAVAPAPPKHDSHLNEVSMRLSRTVALPDMEKYSYNLCYTLRKK